MYPQRSEVWEIDGVIGPATGGMLWSHLAKYSLLLSIQSYVVCSLVKIAHRAIEAISTRSVGTRPRHRDAVAQPARLWRSCAGRYLPDGRAGWHDALRTVRRRPGPAARRPSSAAATAGGRMGCAWGRRARRPLFGHSRSAGGHFAGMPTRRRHARGAGARGNRFRVLR